MKMVSSADGTHAQLNHDRAVFSVPGTLVLVVLLTVLRLATAAYLPLSFDESYFWLWSRRLAISYFEHPPLIAFAIRAGTSLFGDTELGVRFASLCASVVASWAVWRTGMVLFESRTRAWTACAYFNVTLMVASQGMAATPDVFVMAATAFLLLAVAQLEKSEDVRWWIAAGLAVGAAMLAKYTAFFLALSLCVWTLVTPQGRRWLVSPWPWTAAVLALLCLVPNLLWNEAHGWISFKYQFGRVVTGKPSLRYILEFVGAQLALASPFILVLAAIALLRNSRADRWNHPLAMAVAVVWPAILYFAVHCLHDRVQGNWPSFVYPALAILAASLQPRQDESRNRIVSWCQRLALPVATLVLTVSYLQTWTGLLPIGKSDPIARMTAVGFDTVAEEASFLAQAEHDSALVTTRYVASGWLAFYVRPHVPVLQVTEGFRWLDAPVAPSSVLQRPLLYVTQHPERELREVSPFFSKIESKGCLPRSRGGVTIDQFCLYSLRGFHDTQSRMRGAIAFAPGGT